MSSTMLEPTESRVWHGAKVFVVLYLMHATFWLVGSLWAFGWSFYEREIFQSHILLHLIPLLCLVAGIVLISEVALRVTGKSTAYLLTVAILSGVLFLIQGGNILSEIRFHMALSWQMINGYLKDPLVSLQVLWRADPWAMSLFSSLIPFWLLSVMWVSRVDRPVDLPIGKRLADSSMLAGMAFVAVWLSLVSWPQLILERELDPHQRSAALKEPIFGLMQSATTWDIHAEQELVAELDLLQRNPPIFMGGTAPRRDVVYIVADALRPDRLSWPYGYHTSTSDLLQEWAHRHGMATYAAWGRSVCPFTPCGFHGMFRGVFPGDETASPSWATIMSQAGWTVDFAMAGFTMDYPGMHRITRAQGRGQSFDGRSCLRGNGGVINDDLCVLDLIRRMGPISDHDPRVTIIYLMSTHEVGQFYPEFRTPDWNLRLGNDYNGRVRQLADRISQVLDTLKANGRLKNDPLIVITADHGEALGENGQWGHGLPDMPEKRRIPIIIMQDDRSRALNSPMQIIGDLEHPVDQRAIGSLILEGTKVRTEAWNGLIDIRLIRTQND